MLDGRLLADGGILDPLPMAPISAVNADVTIAVSLSGGDPAARRRRAEPRATAEWLNRMWRSTTALLDTKATASRCSTPRRPIGARAASATSLDDDADGADERTSGAAGLGSFEVMNRTIDIAQAALARHTLAAYPPDLLIEVPRTACRSLEFHRADEVIEIGQELAAIALDALGQATQALGTRPRRLRLAAALLATGERRRLPARRVERIGAEGGERLVVGEHRERRAGEGRRSPRPRRRRTVTARSRPAAPATTATSQSPASGPC